MGTRPGQAPVDDPYEGLRPLLFSIAYRMVSSVSEAEDIVQEAFLRFHRQVSAGASIDSPKAYLSTVTTRLSIDHLRSARARRERYVGTWLPEPILTDEGYEAARQEAERADSLSLAFLVLLESLSPVERAVFLLREVFDRSYFEIAAIVGKSEDNCRQIARRARRQVAARQPRFEASRARREELARRFFDALATGDLGALVDLLAADVVAYADGGGKATAFPRPVHGRENVARLFVASISRGERLGVAGVRPAEVNGQPGAVLLDTRGSAVLVLSLDIADDLVQTIRVVTNPDKLRHLSSTPEAGGSDARR
jgi:RNA polymerase sigma-70 factor, ECF subfamily